MRITRLDTMAATVLVAAAFALPAVAATEQVLYSFTSPNYGYPEGRLRFVKGSLFGTGSGGGSEYGQVFELTNSGGSWKETSPLKFNNTDGAFPAAGLFEESGGYLFGTTTQGDAYGGGNAFILYKLGGSWTHGTIWSFSGTAGDGLFPYCDLIADSSANLYGTTTQGGVDGYGTVFELTENFGSWTETVLYSFKNGNDSATPYAGLVMDKTGALYGTTSGLNVLGVPGAVFQLTQSGGVWTEKTLYTFTGGTDGGYPTSALVLDSKGRLYGTTYYGGASGYGTVFEVYQSGGAWKEKVLYPFQSGSDGANPYAGLLRNGSGGFYGTTASGGTYGYGTAFELTLSGGVWSETKLHDFGLAGDGADPIGAVILDKSGNLYGTANTGGGYGYGAVWEITP